MALAAVETEPDGTLVAAEIAEHPFGPVRLAPGQTVAVSIEGLGTLGNPVTAR